MKRSAPLLATWVLPFLIAGGMALGALIGMVSRSNAMVQDGPAGDAAGAAGALVVVICAVAGFVTATVTIILAKILRPAPPRRILLRFGLSIFAGWAVGALAAVDMGGGLAWLPLLGAPALLAWPWQARASQSNLSRPLTELSDQFEQPFEDLGEFFVRHPAQSPADALSRERSYLTDP